MFTRAYGIVGGLAVAAMVLGLAGSAQAQGPGRPAYGRTPANQTVAPTLRPPIPDSRRMPGWDWKYLYPQVYYQTHGYRPYPYPYVYPYVYPYTPVLPVNPYNPIWPYGLAAQ